MQIYYVLLRTDDPKKTCAIARFPHKDQHLTQEGLNEIARKRFGKRFVDAMVFTPSKSMADQAKFIDQISDIKMNKNPQKVGSVIDHLITQVGFRWGRRFERSLRK